MKCSKVAAVALLAAAAAPACDGFLPTIFNRRQNNKNPSHANAPRYVTMDRSAMSGFAAPNDDSVRKAYDEWRGRYNKGKFDGLRYENFKVNYVRLSEANEIAMRKARMHGVPEPKPLELNQFGDLSTAEYQAMKNGNMPRAADASLRRQIETMETAFSDFKTFSGENTRTEVAKPDPEAERVRSVYSEWCEQHGKEFDEERLKVFSNNLRQVEKYQNDTGKVLKLNEHSDLTQAEYNSKFNAAWTPSKKAMEASPAQTGSSSTSKSDVNGGVPDRVVSAYKEWCSHFGKVYNQDRLLIFQANFLQVEEYYKSTGIAIKINEYADLAPEEYETMKSGQPVPRNQPNATQVEIKKAEQDATLKLAESLIRAERKAKADEQARLKQAEARRTLEWESMLKAEASRKAQAGARIATEIGAQVEAMNVTTISVDRKEAILKEHFRTTYQEYCEYYHKEFDESRIPLFKDSIIEINRQLRTTGKRVELDEYADLTAEEAAARRKAVEEAKAQVEQDSLKWASEESQLLNSEYAFREAAEVEARLRAEREAARIKAEQFAQKKAEESKRLAELAAAEVRRKAAEEAKLRAEHAAKRRAEKELAQIKAEQEAKRLADEAAMEARRKREEEAHRRAAEAAQIQAEKEAAIKKAEQDAQRRIEAETKRLEELEAKLRAEAAARQKAEEEAKRLAEENARIKAAEESRQRANDQTLLQERRRRADDVGTNTTPGGAAGQPKKSTGSSNTGLWSFFQPKKKVEANPTVASGTDSMASSGAANAPQTSSDVPEKVRRAYEKWCKFYDKPFEEARLPIFQSNLLQVDQYFNNAGSPSKINVYENPAKLNKHADRTVEEYKQIQTTASPPPTRQKPHDSTPLVTVSDGKGGPGPMFPSGGTYAAKLQGTSTTVPTGGGSASFAEDQLNDLSGLAGSSDSMVPPTNDNVRGVYQQWCQMHQRPLDESRVSIFEGNFRRVEQHLKSTTGADRISDRDILGKLNEHADKTVEEYKQIQASSERGEAQRRPKPNQSSGSNPLMTVSDGNGGPGPMFPSGGSYVAKLKGLSPDATAAGSDEYRPPDGSSLPEEQLNDLSGLTGAPPPQREAHEPVPEKARTAYQKWCEHYNKPYDASRLPVFNSNLVQVEKYFKNSDFPIDIDVYESPEKLNQNADRTVEEYELIKQSESAAFVRDTHTSLDAAAIDNPASKPSQNDDVRGAYAAWCKQFNKEFDESRFKVFANNMKQKEQYEKETGEVVKLNEYSDLTPEEFNARMSDSRASDARTSTSRGGGMPGGPGTINSGSEPLMTVSDGVGTGPNFPSGGSYMAKMRGETTGLQSQQGHQDYSSNVAAQSAEVAPDKVRIAYQQWCKIHNMPFDESRISIFEGNFLKVQEYYRSPKAPTKVADSDIPARMNKHADRTIDEFQQIQAAAAANAAAKAKREARSQGRGGSGGSSPLISMSDGGGGPGPQFPSGGSYVAKMKGLSPSEIAASASSSDRFSSIPEDQLNDLSAIASGVAPFLNDAPYDEGPPPMPPQDTSDHHHIGYPAPKSNPSMGVAPRVPSQNMSDHDHIGYPTPKSDPNIGASQRVSSQATPPHADPPGFVAPKTNPNKGVSSSDGVGRAPPRIEIPEGATAGPQQMGRPQANDNAARPDVRQVYMKWCEYYRKDFDESRLGIFRENFLQMEKFYESSGKQINLREDVSKLNQYTDRTKEEHKAIQESELASIAMVHDDAKKDPARKSEVPENIRMAYEEWCSFYKKDYDESRLQIFQKNFLQVQKYYKSAGKGENMVRLNEHADRTKEEHKEIQTRGIASRASPHDVTKKRNSNTPKAVKGSSPVANPAKHAGPDVPENIRRAYKEWCSFYKKEFDEARLPIFEGNFRQVEKYYKSKGNPIELNENKNVVKLNEYADRTVEEYKKIMAASPNRSSTQTSKARPPKRQRESEVNRVRKSFSESMQRPEDEAKRNAVKRVTKSVSKRGEQKPQPTMKVPPKRQVTVKAKDSKRSAAQESVRLAKNARSKSILDQGMSTRVRPGTKSRGSSVKAEKSRETILEDHGSSMQREKERLFKAVEEVQRKAQQEKESRMQEQKGNAKIAEAKSTTGKTDLLEGKTIKHKRPGATTNERKQHGKKADSPTPVSQGSQEKAATVNEEKAILSAKRETRLGGETTVSSDVDVKMDAETESPRQAAMSGKHSDGSVNETAGSSPSEGGENSSTPEISSEKESTNEVESSADESFATPSDKADPSLEKELIPSTPMINSDKESRNEIVSHASQSEDKPDERANLTRIEEELTSETENVDVDREHPSHVSSDTLTLDEETKSFQSAETNSIAVPIEDGEVADSVEHDVSGAKDTKLNGKVRNHKAATLMPSHKHTSKVELNGETSASAEKIVEVIGVATNLTADVNATTVGVARNKTDGSQAFSLLDSIKNIWGS